MPPRLLLRLLNGFALTADGAPIALSLSAQRVLAFLALHDGPIQRAFVAGSLWLDRPEDRANANLRTALWRLRGCGFALVEARGLQLRLADDVVVDVRSAEARARATLAGRVEALEPDRSAFGGDLLPDWYDDWIVLERERYRQLRLRTLDALCERLTAAGRFDEALQAGLESIACEPLRESAHRAVMRVHLAEGNVGEAIRQYTLCARLLRERLGIAPSPSMEALVARPASARAAHRGAEIVAMRAR
jgi:DNA-binding SARP family transcriptional activator